MSYLHEALVNKEIELQQMKFQLEKSLENVPEGTLNISRKGNHTQYYHYTRNEKNEVQVKYIREEETTLIKALAQKEYDKKVLGVVNEQLKSVAKLKSTYDCNKLKDIYTKMSIKRKRLIEPVVWPDEELYKRWKDEKPGSKNSFSIETGIFTEKGEEVRSKSEKILADKLYLMNIPYKYEYPLELTDKKVMYPDFTILSKKNMKIYYWEHFGMMDKPEYAEREVAKIQQYVENNIFPGEKLIMTFETKKRAISRKMIEQLIARYLM